MKKICKICGEDKPVDEFYWVNSNKTNLDTKCKKCHNKRNRPSISRAVHNLKNRYSGIVKKYEFTDVLPFDDVLSIDRDGFQVYIENRFRDDMTWDNYGNHWVIDHILPINVMGSYDDLIRLNHYSNLQPLLKNYNWKKNKGLTVEGIIKEHYPYVEINSRSKDVDEIDYLFDFIKKLNKKDYSNIIVNPTPRF
jgi:hypothetical protein